MIICKVWGSFFKVCCDVNWVIFFNYFFWYINKYGVIFVEIFFIIDVDSVVIV